MRKPGGGDHLPRGQTAGAQGAPAQAYPKLMLGKPVSTGRFPCPPPVKQTNTKPAFLFSQSHRFLKDTILIKQRWGSEGTPSVGRVGPASPAP